MHRLRLCLRVCLLFADPLACQCMKASATRCRFCPSLDSEQQQAEIACVADSVGLCTGQHGGAAAAGCADAHGGLRIHRAAVCEVLQDEQALAGVQLHHHGQTRIQLHQPSASHAQLVHWLTGVRHIVRVCLTRPALVAKESQPGPVQRWVTCVHS